ncbi:hypothetical protein [Flavobacterium sp.]|uniref:hypothetical protein n=1 Tax=Flavobacterium sp. TaxID=239 RepID=UPI00261D686F|nr:hypothetical protein [Flavobacterium sp.]MDD2986778.1 hypothetical protein [Flavobacterium sp.]
MKKGIFLLPIFVFLVQSCIFQHDDEVYPPSYNAEIMEREAFENSIQLLPARSVIKSGKIYVKDDYAFINEVNEGFHIFNYSNPENPIPISFLKVPGATDLSIRNNVFYINQAVDLVTLAYQPTSNTYQFLYRNRNMFPQKQSPGGDYTPLTENQIIINWIPN